MEGLMEEKKVLPQGYKNSVLGLIPNDWEIKTLGQMLEKIVGGGTPSRVNVDFWNGNIPWATVKDLSNFSAFRTQEYITEEGLKKSSSNIIPKNTLITATRMALGKVVKFQVDVAINQDLKAIFPKPDVDSQFLYYWFQLNSKVIIDLGNGSTVKGIVLDDLRNIKFIKIPFSEQKAIADCLSTWDKSIEKLNHLIAQKELRKKGLMQELLTGKKRLRGFDGEWEVTRLASDCELITKGTTPTSLGHTFKTSGINFIKIESLEENGNIIPWKVAYIDSNTHDFLRRSQLKENDILISIAGALGRVAIVDQNILPANTNQALAIIRLKQEAILDLKYLFYYLNGPRIKQEIDEVNVQAAQANLSLANIGNFKILKPKKNEQIAIANVLQSADKEIQLLKNKLEQLKVQKNGLMQVLLTGKKRLKY